MGVLSWFRRTNALAPAPDLLARIGELERAVAQLQQDRPGFIVSLEELAERCHDILDQAESKRARAAARESRQRRSAEHDQGDEQLDLWKADRALAKAQLFANRPPSWRRH